MGKNKQLDISAAKHNLKVNFAVHSKYEPFYTGGHVQLSEDGKHLFCTCDCQVHVLDTDTGKVLKTVRKEGDDDAITAFTVDQKGEILVVSLRSGLLRQWQWKTGVLVRTWKSIHSGPIRCMTFDPTSVLLATGGSDSTIKVWDLEKQYCTHNLKGASGVFTVVKYHLEGSRQQILGAADDYKIHIWEVSSGRHIAALEGHFSAVTCLAFAPTANTLFSSGRDKVVLVWNLNSYTLQKTIPVFESLESVMLIPERRLLPKLNVTNSNELYIVTAGSQGILKVWNVETGAVVYTQTESLASKDESDDSLVTSSFYNASLDAIVVVTYDHNILVYALDDFSRQKQLIGYNDEVLDIRFFGQNDTHLVVATNSPIIKVFELSTFNCYLLVGHTDLVLAVDVFRSKPDCMVSSSKDNTVKLWQRYSDTGEISCIFTGLGHTHSVTTVSCSRLTESFLVSGSQDTTLKVWDVPGKVCLVVSNPTLVLRCTQRAHEKEINHVAVAPNDKLIVSASQDKTAKVWRSEDLALVGTVRGHRKGIWCACFSPVDQVFCTASADGTIKIWALNNLSCVKTLEGHECSVMKVAFLSQGMQLVTAGSDGNVKLWNIKLNECMKTLDEHSDRVWTLDVSNDESLVVTGSADSKIILWKDVTEEEIEKQYQEMEDEIEKNQELSNFIQQKDWPRALALAITLGKPFNSLRVIKEILMDSNGQQVVDRTLKAMRPDQIDSLLKFASVWNTNSKHCMAAQLVLRAVLTTYTPGELLQLPTTKQLVEELLPYTERHMQRLNRLQQQASFVNYIWQTMRLGSLNSNEAENQQKSDIVVDSGEEKAVDLSSQEDDGSASNEQGIDLHKEFSSSVNSVEKQTTKSSAVHTVAEESFVDGENAAVENLKEENESKDKSRVNKRITRSEALKASKVSRNSRSLMLKTRSASSVKKRRKMGNS